MPLTYVTAYQALVEQLKIAKGEQAAVFIINGAGGVGAVASQIARWVLELPVVVTTASRDESVRFTKRMGATHVLNHREDLVRQMQDLKLDVPVKYVLLEVLGGCMMAYHVADIYSSRIQRMSTWILALGFVRRSVKSVRLCKDKPRCTAQSLWQSLCLLYGV